MKMHYLQHVPFEGPGIITSWGVSHDCHLSSTSMFNGKKLPDPSPIDALVVLGGPMSVHDEDQYPWLKEEKEFIRECIRQNKKILGICFGAQLIADVLGAGVYPNKMKEVGWFSTSWNSYAKSHPLFNFLPSRQIVLHWHGDVFKLPAGAMRLASSRCCKNQAFIYKGHVVGFQFHLEMRHRHLKQLISNSREELKERGLHMQSAEHILDRPGYVKSNNSAMIRFLDRFFLGEHRAATEALTAGKRY